MRPKFCHTHRSIFKCLWSPFSFAWPATNFCNCNQLISLRVAPSLVFDRWGYTSATSSCNTMFLQWSSAKFREKLIKDQAWRENLWSQVSCNQRGVRPKISPIISIRFSWNKLPLAFLMVLICSLKSGFALGFQWDLTEHQIKLPYSFSYGINWLKMSLSFRLGPSGITELSFHMVYV